MILLSSLKALRKAKGLTQETISSLIGISMRNYRAKETGKLPFTQAEISRLINILDLNPNEVYFYFFILY